MKGITWTNFVLGIWFVAAPFILGFTSKAVAFWENIIIGLLIAVFSLLQLLVSDEVVLRRYNWAIAAFGVWALFAPFLLGYSGLLIAALNDMVVGFFVATLATCAALNEVTIHHGGHHHGSY